VLIATSESLQTGAVYLEASSPRRTIQSYAADGSWARLQAPAGRFALRIRSIQMGEAILDSLDVRRGFADTLWLIDAGGAVHTVYSMMR
jgi:hypothetical protein